MIETLQHYARAGLLFWLVASGLGTTQAAVPQQLNHQGRVAVNGVNFDGTGQFKFALVNANGSTTYWSNDGSSSAGSQPSSHVTLAVTKGLYSVLLGDTTLTNMTALPSSALDHEDVRLRIWFNDGSSRGFQLITPDQRLAALPYALLAAKATSTIGFDGSLAGDVTGPQGATSITPSTVTGKVLTGFSSTTGSITTMDTILTAINKLNGNDGLKANLASPSFTGTVTLPAGTATVAPLKLTTGINLSTAVFGSVEFDGTHLYLTNNAGNPTRKTIAFTDSTLASGAVGSNQLASGLTLGGTTTGTFSGPLAGNVTGNVTGSAGSFTGSLAGDVTGPQGATSITPSTVTGKVLTGFSSTTGSITTTDTILTAINKLNGNDGLKANLDSPNFTGTVTLPAGTATVAPLKLTTGINLSTAVLGSVEFDGNNLYLTTNAASPTRKTVALSDTGSSSQLLLSNIVAAPVKPVVAWGSNSNGQTTLPSLSGVAAVAAGAYHSIVLLDVGTVVAWGLNDSGQTTVPSTATGVTEVTAGAEHNLVRKSDGTLIAWGNNTYGQCTIPANITTATKVAAGQNHSLALLANGTLRAWGDNTWGQTTIPSSLTGVTVTAIASGQDHNLALTAAGAVVAWGRGSEQGGAGQITVPSAATTGVIAIAAGALHSLALKSNGTVVAWGFNEAGQCNVPGDLSGVTQIAAGYGFSMALKSNGAIVVWGEKADGVPTLPATATEVTAIAAGARHALALRSDLTPAQVARLDLDNVFTGKVTIQGKPGTHALEVNGTAIKSTGSSWLTSSDRRIKTDIESINGALEKLDQVRLVDFRYTADYLAAHPEIENRRYPNVIAQEFQQVFPDDVKRSGQRLPDGSEILQVDTYPLTIYSAAAIQELHRENRLLKKKLDDQEQRLRKLEEILKKK
jgi:hypothetical protein